jgi:hypothetical protein
MKHAVTAVLAVLLVSTIVQAEIPQVMGYQGRVTDNGGNPVANGSYTMRFRIYDNSGGSGSPLWDSGSRTVAVSGGVFSVMLGESPQPALGLAFDQDYWLLVTFGGQNQTPLRRLGSVGYAYMASGLVPGTEVGGSVTGPPFAVIKGTNTATTGFAYGLWGETSSDFGSGIAGEAPSLGVYGYASAPGGRGVYGLATAASGYGDGVRGESSSTSGAGVHGKASAASGVTDGVLGEASSTTGRGVYGLASAATGPTTGVYGRSHSGSGIGVLGEATAAGTGDTTFGGWFENSTWSGAGVVGKAYATYGNTYGVHGESSSQLGAGVYGLASATTGYSQGVLGIADSGSGSGVAGSATATSGSARGVSGSSQSPSGIGVYAEALASSGTTYGVYGTSFSTTEARGVFGHSPFSDTGVGVYGETGSTLTTSFGVYYSGGLGGTGLKSCVVRTSEGPTLLYCQESPQCWFEDFGEGELVSGRAHVDLDPLFRETVTIDDADPMKVFVQPDDPECEGLAVARGTSSFDVVELRGGSSNTRFTYRVVAKRKGFEKKRLDYCKAAETDPYLYPELREKLFRERGRMERERPGAVERRAPLQDESRDNQGE